MDFFDKNSPKKAKLLAFPTNNIFNQPINNNLDKNAYSHYLIPNSKPNIKSTSKLNNQIFHEITCKNKDCPIKENPKMIKFLTEYYSYPFKNLVNKNVSLNKTSNMKKNNILLQKEYQTNQTNKNKYTNYSPHKRYTLNHNDKKDPTPDIIESNSNQINTYDKENKYLLNLHKKKRNNQYEKSSLLNQMINSKSTNNFYGEDILIEYNNVPIIDKEPNFNKSTLGGYNNINKDYLIKNSNLNNINNYSYENINNNSYIENNNNIKNIFYVNNNFNKINNESDFVGKSYFDVNISNIEENHNLNNSKEKDDIYPNYKNWQFARHKNIHNIQGKNLKNNIFDEKSDCDIKNSFVNYQNNNNIFDIDDDNFNINLYKSNPNENMFKLQKANTELFRNKTQNKQNINNYKIININKSIYLNNNEVEKNNNMNDQKLKNFIIKSKKDIFQNKEYTNMINLGNPKLKKRISPEPKNKYFSKAYHANINEPKTTKNNNNNIIYHEIYEPNNIKPINNKRNNNIKNNLYKYNLLTEKNIDNKKLYDYMIKDNKDISYINYEVNENKNNVQAKEKIKISKITHYKSSKNNCNYVEIKNNTSRYDNTRLEAKNVILSQNISPNNGLNTKISGYKSSKNISINKKVNKNINKFYQKENISFTPLSDDLEVKSNNCKSKKNNINIELEEKNKKEMEKESYINSKTETNIQPINKKVNIKMNNKNKILNANSFSIMKNMNIGKNFNNLPIKLYLRKNQKKSKKDNNKQIDHSKDNNKKETNTQKNNITKQIKGIYKNKSDINMKIINSNNINNLININSPKENEKILNEQNNKVNDTSLEQKKIDKTIYMNRNKYFTNIGTKESNKINKNNNKAYIKTITNELFDKNKNIKTFKFISPMINRNNNKSNSIVNNFPSYIQTSTFDIKNNNQNINIQTDNNSKSNKNIFYKGTFSEHNRAIKQMILNKSSQLLFNDKKLNMNFIPRNTTDKICSNFFRDTVISNQNMLNDQNNDNKKNHEMNPRNTRNYKISKDNKNINKLFRSPTIESNLNLINYNEKINLPKTANLTQINSSDTKTSKNNSGVYMKPCGLVSKSKSKTKRIKKTKSMIKIFQNNSSERNVNEKKIMKRAQSYRYYFFKTSPLFHQKDEYFQSEFGSIKRGSTSLNTSHITKYENSSIKTKENELSLINNSTLINFIKEPYKKEYFFAHKIYNYFLKSPKIEQCYFNKKNFSKLSHEDLNNNRMDNLRITFKNFNHKDNKILSPIQDKINLNNYENNIYNDIEESDLDIFKELQKKMQNNHEEKSNNDKSLPIDKEVLIYETIQKLKALKKDYNQININPDKEKEIEQENIIASKSKTYEKDLKYKNLQNGIRILENMAIKKGLKIKKENNDNIFKHSKNGKKDENIFLEANKSNDLYNMKKEIDNNSENIYDDKVISKINKAKKKCSKSVKKDIIKGISKIENVFGKNNINIISNSNEDNKLYNLENVFDYSQEQEQKTRTYIPRRKNELNITKDKSDINSNFEEIKLNDYNKEIEHYYDDKNRKSYLDNKEIKINNFMDMQKKNIESSNHYRESISYSDEDIVKLNKSISDNINKNSSQGSKKSSNNNSEDFDNYLKIMKKNKSNDILNQDLTFLLNIVSKGNFNFVLKQITQIILYKKNKSDDKNIPITKTFKSNSDIIYNEHLFTNLIFKQITKAVKYICLYSKLCADLNQNILNDLSEQKNMKNNKERNLKLIINDKCIQVLNDFKKEEINIFNNSDYDAINYFKAKIIGFVNFVYELINIEILKQQFGIYVLEQLYKLFNNANINKNNNDCITNIYLDGIIFLTNKLGTIFYEKENLKLQQNINNYICNYLMPLIDYNNNKNKIPINLKYRIINLISKQENKWKESLYEIYEKEEKIKILPELKSNLSNPIISNEKLNYNTKPKELSIQDINKALIKEDIINYISYFSEENNKGKINIKSFVDKSYNWKVIDELVNNKNFGLESIINYFISICSSFSYDDNKIILCNDYIKNIIEFYANNLSKKAVESLQNEMIKTFSEIDEIVEQNNDMYKILGNLLFVLIDNKLFLIKFFNHYLKMNEKAQINLAMITKYCIISSGKFAKKYLNDFKQTKLFNNNDIFEKYVLENMKDLLYFIK